MKKTIVAESHSDHAPQVSEMVSNTQAKAPLWLQVARWCLGRQAPVNRHTIAQVFGIPQRQAADLMLYISGQHGDRVQVRRRVTVMAGGIREATLEVLSIHDSVLPARRGVAHQAPRRQRKNTTIPAELRDLALGRRKSGGTA